MQLANQIFFIATFFTLLGLLAPYLWGIGPQKSKYWVIYEPLALGCFALSSLAFFADQWAEGLGLPVANIALVAGALYIWLLFNTWDQPITISKKIFTVFWLIAIGAVYIYLMGAGPIKDRVYLINGVLALISLGQLAALFRVIKKNSAYQIKLLITVVLFQFCLSILCSAILFFEPEILFSISYQENILIYYLHILLFLSNVVICILITNYYLETLMQEHENYALAIEEGMLYSLNAFSMARDNETGNHIIRTKNYVQAIASRLQAMGLYQDELSKSAIDQMVKAAPLHDIGKVGILDSILKKQGPLTPDEWTIMKTHTSIGEDVLRVAMVKDTRHTRVLEAAIKIAGCHHENWDGSGYPRGLSGKDIPLAARIMSLADMYDALVSQRIYKHPWSHEEACAEIIRLKDSRFDPLVVDAFMMEIDHFVEISTQYRDKN